MATFEMTGPDGTYQVDAPDEAAALSAFKSFTGGAKAPDKYQQAAIDEQSSLKDQGIDEGAGYTRRLAHGATLGADNTIVAAALSPLEAIRRGVGLSEGYNYAKAREDQIMGDARKNTGTLGTAAELGGGAFAGAALARGGLTAGSLLSSAPSLLGRTAAMGVDGAALGGFSGAMEGNGLQERGSNALNGAAVGAGLGVALPVAAKTIGAVASPFISNIMARANPEGYASRQVARALTESNQTPQQIADAVQTATGEGQGMFTVADAMGNPGQRMLSSVARAPGEGRTQVVDFLEGRQGTQGRRVSNALAEGFAAPESAAQTEARLTAARGAQADTDFSAVRSDATPVDLSAAIAHVDQTLSPGVNQIARPQSGIANDSAEAALQNFRDRLTDDRSVLTDFTSIQRVRGDLSDAVQQARQQGSGNKARLLGGLLREIDTAMESASPGHRAANANFAQASRNIEAVQTGRDAAMRGRTEDTIPAYQSLTPEGQQAFRSGYVDPLIAQTQGAAFGVNKARPLLNDALAAEADAMAPGNALMQRRLGREQRMFETRNTALGGSKTADNLADAESLGIDPTMVGNLLAGNYGAAVKSVIHAGSRAITGNTPAVRKAIADILLQRGNASGTALDQAVGRTLRQIQFVQNLARDTAAATRGAVAVNQNANKRKARAAKIFGVQ